MKCVKVESYVVEGGTDIASISYTVFLLQAVLRQVQDFFQSEFSTESAI
jgi:hypothetical protein